MHPKLSSVLGSLYFRDEFGVLHEINGISNIEVVPSRELLKQHIKWINRLNRHIRREKRIKEQARRAKLKWRALHHDGE